jgi:lysophospholipase L1-like esterase
MFTKTNRMLILLTLWATSAMAGQNTIERESIEWCNVWITHGTEHALPRVLLIGDSITQGYYAQVETKLAGKAYVGRLTTSKSLGDPALLDEVATVLKQYRFDVIHFNNGLHGQAYTEPQYARAFPKLIATIRKGAPKAELIWATSTPVREGEDLHISPRTERVKARNQIALAIVTKERIPVNDLFALVIDHPEYFSRDGVHASPQGVAAEAEVVAKAIQAQLEKIQSR